MVCRRRSKADGKAAAKYPLRHDNDHRFADFPALLNDLRGVSRTRSWLSLVRVYQGRRPARARRKLHTPPALWRYRFVASRIVPERDWSSSRRKVSFGLSREASIGNLRKQSTAQGPFITESCWRMARFSSSRLSCEQKRRTSVKGRLSFGERQRTPN